MNAARKGAIEYSPEFLTTQVRQGFVNSNSFDLIPDVDEGALCPRPFHGDLQTPDARTLHQCLNRESVGHHLAGRHGLLAKRAAHGCPHLHQGHGRRSGERDGYQCIRNAAGADACGVASAGGCGMPWCGNMNRNPGEECGPTWCTRNLGSRHGQYSVFRSPPRPLGMRRVLQRIRQQLCQWPLCPPSTFYSHWMSPTISIETTT